MMPVLAARYRSAPPPAGVVWTATSGITRTNANKTAAKTAGGGAYVPCIASGGWSSGAHYFEIVLAYSGASPFTMIGLVASLPTNYPGGSAGWGYYQQTGQKVLAAVTSTYGASYANGDVIGVGYNATLGTIVFFKNGTSQGTAFTGVSGLLLPCGGIYQGGAGNSLTLHTSASEIVSLPGGYSTWE